MNCGTLDCSFEAVISAELTFPDETVESINQEELFTELQEAVANKMRSYSSSGDEGDDEDDNSVNVEITSIRDGSAVVDFNIWFADTFTAETFVEAINATGLDLRYGNSSYVVTYGEVQMVFVIDTASAMTVPVFFLLLAAFLN